MPNADMIRNVIEMLEDVHGLHHVVPTIHIHDTLTKEQAKGVALAVLNMMTASNIEDKGSATIQDLHHGSARWYEVKHLDGTRVSVFYE